jgi:GTPase SAR1 family protein
MKLEGNIEFLNYIYQNAEMGKTTISQLIDIAEDQSLKQCLQSQFREYNQIFDMADNKIKKFQEKSKGLGTMTKLKTYIMININTIKDKTASHIAEMMIQGSSMGIVDITKKLKEYNNAEKDIIELGNRLLKFEQQNIEEMKTFL